MCYLCYWQARKKKKKKKKDKYQCDVLQIDWSVVPVFTEPRFFQDPVQDLVIHYLGNWLRRFERPCETICLFIFVRKDKLLFRSTFTRTETQCNINPPRLKRVNKTSNKWRWNVNVVLLLHGSIAEVYTRKNPFNMPTLKNLRITVVYIKLHGS